MATTSSTRRGRRGNTRERPTRFPIVPPIRLPATTIPATPPPMARLARRSACSPLPALLDTPPPAVCSRMAPMAARSGRSRRRFTWPVRLSPRRSTPRAPWWPRRSTPRAPWWPRCDRAVLYCVPRPGAVQRAHHPLRDGRAALQLPLHRADACRGRLVRNRRREPGVPSITSPARLWKHAWAGAGYSRRPPCVCADPVARKSQRRFWSGTKDIQPRCFRGLAWHRRNPTPDAGAIRLRVRGPGTVRWKSVRGPVRKEA